MTIFEALKAINTFPVSDNVVETILVDRALTGTSDYTLTIGISQAYELAKADTYFWLSTQPSIVEQGIGINQAQATKKQLLAWANEIYGKYDDPKFSGQKAGFIGENYNG